MNIDIKKNLAIRLSFTRRSYRHNANQGIWLVIVSSVFIMVSFFVAVTVM